MDISEILSRVDHTLLSPTATWEMIRKICDEGIEYKTASVCIPPCYVPDAVAYTDGRVKICTVIGFPLGYSATSVKCCETANAVLEGADEIDTVINIGLLKAGRYDRVLDEIKRVCSACKGDGNGRILKVIVETCLLTEDEKRRMCNIVSESGADYIKTSTGFSTGGATAEDIALFKANVAPHVKIKAAGGISSLADAENFIRLGASRLGTSKIVALAKASKL